MWRPAQLSQAQPFEVVPLGNVTLPAADAAIRLEFEEQVAELQTVVLAAVSFIADSLQDLDRIRAALMDAPIEAGKGRPTKSTNNLGAFQSPIVLDVCSAEPIEGHGFHGEYITSFWH